MADTTVRVHPLIRERLKALPSALQAEFGVNAVQAEIVAALVHGATLGQITGMLDVFNRYAAAVEKGAPTDYQQPPAIT